MDGCQSIIASLCRIIRQPPVTGVTDGWALLARYAMLFRHYDIREWEVWRMSYKTLLIKLHDLSIRRWIVRDIAFSLPRCTALGKRRPTIYQSPFTELVLGGRQIKVFAAQFGIILG
jgi:hypothetical protein